MLNNPDNNYYIPNELPIRQGTIPILDQYGNPIIKNRYLKESKDNNIYLFSMVVFLILYLLLKNNLFKKILFYLYFY
jgi:hypothetical protein